MAALLDGEASRHPLCVRRGEAYWWALLSWEGTEAAGRVEGYLLYGQGDGRNTLRSLTVSELAAAPTVREALVSFMAAFDHTMFEVRYSTRRGEPLHPFLQSSYVESHVSPEFMLRLVTIEGALGLLQRASEAPLVLGVEDDEISENAGPYTVGGGDSDVVRGPRRGSG